MPARLEIVEVTSWDFHTAAQITNKLDQDNAVRWTGTVGAMVTGLMGFGQAIEAPDLTRSFKTDCYDTVYARFKFSTTDATSDQVLFDIRDNAATLCYVGLDNNGMLYVDSGFNTWTSEIGPLQDDTVYAVEFAARIHDTLGAFEVRLDADEENAFTMSGVDTWPTSTKPQAVRFQNTILTVDDFVMKLGFEGFSEIDFIGRVDGYPIISTLYPNATGTGAYDAWGAFGTGATKHDRVNEAQANTTNGVNCNVLGDKIGFGFDNLPADADTVQFLKVSAYSRADSGTTATMAHWLRHNGQLDIVHRATNAAMNATWAFREREWPKSLRTGEPWVPSAIAALNAVYERKSAAGDIVSISQIVLEVLWSGADTTEDEYPVDSLRETSSHRHTTCWKIERKDGTRMRFTSHQGPLTIKGKVYEAAGGFDPSAERREGALRERNKDFVGMITSDSITAEDLRAGRYRGAEVEEFVVDWRYADFGRFDTTVYWVGGTEWTETFWSAQVNGATRWLKQSVGDVASRICKHTTGEPGCFVDLRSMSVKAVAVNVPAPGNLRKQFTAVTTDISAGLGDKYFEEGEIRWRSGANWGLVSYVKLYTSSTRTFALHEPTPHDIAAGDKFDADIGDKRNKPACINKFDNFINFDGENTSPGTDASIQTPEQ